MSEAVGPVFVAGCPRSGTTALSWAIAAHPGYHTSAETHFFYYLLREGDYRYMHQVFRLSSGAGSWLEKYGIGYDRFLSYLGEGLDRMMREAAGGLQWVDGSPENVMVGRALLAMFPTAHMVVVMRDPRQVCLSMLNSGFAPEWARDLDAAIREWRYYAQVGGDLAVECPERVLIVRQEDMRRRAGAVAAAIGERLQLSRPEAISDFLRTRTVNSSFDKRTYADDSPFRAEGAPAPVSREAFLAEHGPRIVGATRDLAERFGYFRDEPAAAER